MCLLCFIVIFLLGCNLYLLLGRTYTTPKSFGIYFKGPSLSFSLATSHSIWEHQNFPINKCHLIKWIKWVKRVPWVGHELDTFIKWVSRVNWIWHEPINAQPITYQFRVVSYLVLRFCRILPFLIFINTKILRIWGKVLITYY